MVGGGTLSYRELDDAAARVAGMLHDQGVRPGDRVAIMVPSGPDFLRAWAGVGRLGAVAAVLNCELKGTFLAHPLVDRSEEHTSELQSLMRISYAVFCLKKKNNHKQKTCIHFISYRKDNKHTIESRVTQ